MSTALAVSSLRKSFGDVHAVVDLDMSVAAGECFGLLGLYGAGHVIGPVQLEEESRSR